MSKKSEIYQLKVADFCKTGNFNGRLQRTSANFVLLKSLETLFLEKTKL